MAVLIQGFPLLSDSIKIAGIFLVMVLTALLLYTCRKQEEIKNLNAGRIGALGHAGAGFRSSNNFVPDNSMTSIRKSVELYGAEGVEVDAHMNGEGDFFLYHDILLNTSTNFQGCIYEYSSDELKHCTYRNSLEKLATLEECLIYFSAHELKPELYIDARLEVNCGSPPDYEAYTFFYAARIVELVQHYSASEWVNIESGDIAFLQKIRLLDERIDLFIDGTINDHIDIAAKNKFKGIVAPNATSTRDAIENAHAKGIYVVLFQTENRNGTLDAISKWPDYIQTDNILLLKQLLNE